MRTGQPLAAGIEKSLLIIFLHSFAIPIHLFVGHVPYHIMIERMTPHGFKLKHPAGVIPMPVGQNNGQRFIRQILNQSR